MSWKQPIPTDLHLVFGEDYEASLLYRELIYRASNEDRILPIDGFRIHIKRGETLFSRSSFGKFLSWDKHKCTRVLQSLQSFYKKVSRRTTGKYTLVQILNYDELIKFEQETRQEDDTRQDTRQDTPKSDKSDKSEKKEITNVIEKNSQGGDTEKKEYGDARINYALRVMREKFQRDDFKESKKMQRIFAKQLLTLGKKIGKDEFHKRCTAIAEDPFKFKNCGSLKYIYGELKSYTEILTEEQRKEQARQREIEESDRRSQETWDRIMAKRALYQSQENT